MNLELLPYDLTVCKVSSAADFQLSDDFYFIGKTDEELSLVCKTESAPQNTTDREDGWRGFRIAGMLDFLLIGILSKLSAVLADNQIGIFVVSTFNTDYVLVKRENLEKAILVLKENGWHFSDE